MLKKLFNYQSAGIVSAAFILAISNLASRALGLFRDRLLAGSFGASSELDIYYAAFRFPDLLYNIIIVGAVSAAFLPLFADYFESGKETAWRYAANVLNIVFVALIALGILFFIFAPFVIKIIAPGFSQYALAETVALSRIMFLSPLLLGLSAVVSSMLHYFSRFFIYSLAPIFYNLGIIFGILYLVPRFGLAGLAWGVVLGAAAHLVIQLPALKMCGFSWQPVVNFRDKGIWRTLKLMIPRTISVASVQVNLWVITALGSLLGAGAIAVFNLANNLQYLPVGIIGIAFATAAFPNLAAAAKSKEEFLKTLFGTFKMVFFLTFPLGLIFYMLRAHIVRVVLGTGAFSWEDTRLTAAALGLFAVSVFAQSLIPLLARGFFALKDTLRPTVITFGYVVLSIALSLIFIQMFGEIAPADNIIAQILKISDLNNIGVIALPLALSVASIVQFFLLLSVLRKRIGAFQDHDILDSILRSVLATLLSLPVGYLLLYGFAQFFPTETGLGIFGQGFISGLVTVAMYFFLAILFRSEEVGIIRNSLQKKLLRPKTLPKTIQEENGKI